MVRCSQASQAAHASLSELSPEEVLYVVCCVVEDSPISIVQAIMNKTTENLFHRLDIWYRVGRDYAGALGLAAQDALKPAFRAKILECLLDSGLHAGTAYEGELKCELNKLCEDPSIVEYLSVVAAR